MFRKIFLYRLLTLIFFFSIFTFLIINPSVVFAQNTFGCGVNMSIYCEVANNTCNQWFMANGSICRDIQTQYSGNQNRDAMANACNAAPLQSCTPCGDVSQTCCPFQTEANTCKSGLTCNNGTCTSSSEIVTSTCQNISVNPSTITTDDTIQVSVTGCTGDTDLAIQLTQGASVIWSTTLFVNAGTGGVTIPAQRLGVYSIHINTEGNTVLSQVITVTQGQAQNAVCGQEISPGSAYLCPSECPMVTNYAQNLSFCGSCGSTDETCCISSLVSQCTSDQDSCINNLCVRQEDVNDFYICDQIPESNTNQRVACTDCVGERFNVNTDKIWTALGCFSTINQSNLVTDLVRISVGMSGGIALLLILFGSFTVSTAASNPEQLGLGQEVTTAAITGLVFIILSVVIMQFIGIDILRIPGL